MEETLIEEKPDCLQVDCSDKELDSFIDAFLLHFYTRQYYLDYNTYHGELFTIAHQAKKLYNPELAQFNTYLTRCFLNRTGYLNKKNKEWYEKHLVMPLNMFQAPDLPAALVAQYRELIDTIKESELTERTKEVVIAYVTKPYKTLQDLGNDFGISKQRVSVLIESASQYLKRRGIEISQPTAKPPKKAYYRR